MTEQQITVIEQQVKEIGEIITQLTSQRTELAYRIEELRNMKATLSRLLPAEKRIDNLFS